MLFRSVIVKYVDEAGNELAASTTQKGTVGTSYTTTAKTISNYDLISIPNNATGKFTASTITVTYVYSEVGFDEAIVTVKYVDEAGNEIASSTTECGFVGDSYTTTAKTISGYELVSIPSNASGKFTNETITVTYVYSKTGSSEGTVIVKYVDEDENEISTSITKIGTIGESYTTVARTISGYELISTPSNASGKFTNETITVTYKYKKIIVIAPIINSFTASKQSPQVSGTQVTLTAKATGSGTLQYKFLDRKSTRLNSSHP